MAKGHLPMCLRLSDTEKTIGHRYFTVGIIKYFTYKKI